MIGKKIDERELSEEYVDMLLKEKAAAGPKGERPVNSPVDRPPHLPEGGRAADIPCRRGKALLVRFSQESRWLISRKPSPLRTIWNGWNKFYVLWRVDRGNGSCI